VSTLVAIQAYTRGVNAYLDAMRRRERPSPFEFWALGLQPEQWKDEDSVCWLKMMAYDLGGNLQQELTRYALLACALCCHAVLKLAPEARRRSAWLLRPWLWLTELCLLLCVRWHQARGGPGPQRRGGTPAHPAASAALWLRVLVGRHPG
jgi:hypothetical protein